jgi:hypothetical protein
MAWWAAQIQSHIRLHVGSTTLDSIPRLAARLHSAWLLSARLNSSRLAADDVVGGPHYADVSADWSLTWHANCACWRHNYVMLMSFLSGSVLWVGSSGIRVGSAIRAKKTRGSRVARWCAWAASSPARVGACGHVPCQNFAPFSPVASSLPLLHSGMVKT